MEELLNKLIEKGWKPRGKDYAEVLVYDGIIRFERRFGADCIETFRTLTSKESGLWQFVCKNGMIELGRKEKKWLTPERLRVFDGEYQYRLIESALCDEDKLEEFLLSNINVDGE